MSPCSFAPSRLRRGICVVLHWQQGTESITPEDMGARIGTINYEVLTSALARVPRAT